MKFLSPCFSYVDGILGCSGVAMDWLARKVGTPMYCYSIDDIKKKYNEFIEVFKGFDVYYAVKANYNLEILKALAEEGCGADVVSIGEIEFAIHAGIPPNRVVFSGVGKSYEEIASAIEYGIYQFNVESIQELKVINQVAGTKGVVVPVAVRLNPDLDAGSHEKITTGLRDSKFGLPFEILNDPEISESKHISVVGISAHLGSQVVNLKGMYEMILKLGSAVKLLRSLGHNVTRCDIGGGFGVNYYEGDSYPKIFEYADMINKGFRDSGVRQICDLKLMCEPGRWIVAEAGVLLTSVLYVKKLADSTKVIVDAGMNDMARCAIYGACHSILPVSIDGNLPEEEVDVVGPVCESSDVFIKGLSVNRLVRGDLLTICTVGAYASSMSSEYNLRPLVPEVVIKNSVPYLSRGRGSVGDIISRYYSEKQLV